VKQPRIWDTIIFGTESDLDVLECRLTELDTDCYRFVISEARVDHQGHPKPLWLRDNWERFAPWHDRIIHVETDTSDIPPAPDRVTYWPIEWAQREAIRPALADIQPEDWLIHGDTDEIPRAGMIQPGYVYRAQSHAYALEWLCPDGWRSLVCQTAADAPRSLQAMREQMTTLPVYEDSSWHLSWFGGIPAQLAKFSTTVHADIPREVSDAVASGRLMRDGWHWQGAWVKLKPYRGDDFPRWVRDGNEPASWHKNAALIPR
jgi:hypothetical protein